MAIRSVGKPIFVFLAFAVFSIANAKEKALPQALQPWKPWVLWGEEQLDCPQPYNNSGHYYCAWPAQLSLTADQKSGSWNATVTVFAETWVALPGRDEVWPLNVRSNERPISVVERHGQPSVKLAPGVYKIAGDFQWSEMPQRIAIPKQFGIIALEVEGQYVPLPAWGSDGLVWLKRQRAQQAAKDLLATQVYRVIEDGIPLWLRTEIELTVSGKSREEELGSVLPQGWILSTVNSPIPVAVDSEGKLKAQVRAGKWNITLHAFRTENLNEFQYGTESKPIVGNELIGFRAKPDFRIAEFEGIPSVDVNQTTFPKQWRKLPVYAWNTAENFRLVEKMRGMGLRRPAGLRITRQLWLDDDGGGFTYRDHLIGNMQQIWRLDVSEGQELGAVRIDGQGQLITANPQTGAHGVEIRNRNLNMDAVGRTEQVEDLLATGWQTSADSLSMTLTLPPGWRILALFGADQVRGDWLTAWTLLDLFLTLIFSLAVYRLWGLKAGIVALLAFALAYHEPSSPRLTWFFLLMPLALLQVVTAETGRRLLKSWRNLALAALILNLVPFIAWQVQSAIYPQLEDSGRTYGDRDMFPRPLRLARRSASMSDYDYNLSETKQSLAGIQARNELLSMENMQLDPRSRVQTGPAEPEWNWNQVICSWNGPVSAGQQIKPIFLTSLQRRVLTIVRIVLLLLLLAMLLGARLTALPFGKRTAATILVLCTLFVSGNVQAQIPDAEMLKTLRDRLLQPADAFPGAADIPSVELNLEGNRLIMTAEIHAAIDVAVPLPGRLPAWSPISVKMGTEEQPIVRRSGEYLWIVVKQGVHQVTVEGLLPDTAEWEWTFQLKPRYVSINAPDWNVTGISPDGIPEGQVFFSRQQQLSADQAAYDQEQFDSVVLVDRQLETGLAWKIHNKVTRLSDSGKALSLRVPLLAGERVLTSKTNVKNDLIDIRLGANQTEFQWESELPVGALIQLVAQQTDQWVERWQLVSSPVWNVGLSGLAPVFETEQQNLVPTWYPWPGESTTLAFSKPEAIHGETITIKRVRHETILGSRQKTTNLAIGLECSLAEDFEIAIDPEAEVSQLKVEGQMIPVQRVANQIIVPTLPGKQTIEVTWIVAEPLETTVDIGQVTLPIEASNVTSIIEVPRNRWVLWAAGPQMGPAVRFWTILVCALLLAITLGSIPWSPLRKHEWILLALGLTQVHVFSAMLVVGWLFLLAWRGRLDTKPVPSWRFNLIQFGVVLLTCFALGILVAVVGEGLLGNPDMFVLGNGSSRVFLQWFQPRTGTELPNPYFASVSVWYYRLLMLLWALWLAVALLRWLKWGWQQFTQGEGWRQPSKKSSAATEIP